ncbi:MAG: 1-acyl-sn-glycerol-3-phosphate acyltransferase [Woeseiaceae bacterium]|nr:1-acyl-sn-glycerol-3-phosphate acyltransferase [Woeseiaceae bacterium]
MLKPIARGLLWLGGWTPIGELPTVPKAVVIAYPHTSNWDGIWALIYKVYIGLDVRFFGKDTLFWFPLNIILRALGCIPLDRNAPGAAVQQAVDELTESESFFFGLAPEGTRSLKEHWKTGFYRIATQANVPIVIGIMDYGRKQIGLGPTLQLSGDPDTDLASIRAAYDGVEARWPEKATPIAFPPSAGEG